MSVSLNRDVETQVTTSDEPAVKPTARERSWLQARLEKGKRERFSEVVTITPGLASLMLVQNLGNRQLTRRQIVIHIDRLQRGDFILTHQGISFAKTGVLNDGQHRLFAILESGIPGQIQITFGAERAEFQVVDQSRKRGALDTLSILGESHAALRASVARVLWIHKQPAITAAKGTLRPDPQLFADYAMELRSASMDDALRMGQSLSRVTTPTAAAVAYWFIATHSKHKDRIADFWLGMTTGENLTGVRLRLREWLRNREASVVSNEATHRAAGIIHAWNSFVTGKRTFVTAWRHAYRLPDVL